jgi:3-oxoacyl-[acyl-carrier-protein] synthase-3
MNKPYETPLIGTGIYLPEKLLTNEDFEKRNIILRSGRQLKAEQILEKIGIERRHIALDDETVADMGYLAARAASVDKPKAELVLASTSHPTSFHLATTIADRLGLTGINTFDIHAACSGSAMMFSYLFEKKQELDGKSVLLVTAEKFSPTVVDLTHKDAISLDSSLGQTIFGDGAAALSFVAGQDIKILYAINKALPEESGKKDLIMMAMGENKFIEPCLTKPVASTTTDNTQAKKDFPKGYFVQNGPKVFEVIQNNIPGIIRESVKSAGLSAKEIGLVVVHPGSKRLVDALKSKLESEYKVYSDYADGNMSSASMLYSFIKAVQEKRIGRGSKVVLSGFGAGSPDLFSSTAVIELL